MAPNINCIPNNTLTYPKIQRPHTTSGQSSRRDTNALSTRLSAFIGWRWRQKSSVDLRIPSEGKDAKCARTAVPSPRCANETRVKLIEHPSQLRRWLREYARRRSRDRSYACAHRVYRPVAVDNSIPADDATGQCALDGIIHQGHYRRSRQGLYY